MLAINVEFQSTGVTSEGGIGSSGASKYNKVAESTNREAELQYQYDQLWHPF